MLRLRVRGLEALRVRVAVVAVLALAGAGIALTLTPSTGIDTFVSSSSSDYAATQATYRAFGADPVIVLVRAPLTRLIQERNLSTLSSLEACLAGQRLRLDTRLQAYVPVTARRARPYGGWSSPCGALMRLRAAQVVYGPATFLNRAVAAVNSELSSLTQRAASTIRAAERAARRLARSRGLDAAQTQEAVQAAGALALERELAASQAAGAGTRSSTGSSRSAAGLLAGVPSIADAGFLRQIVFGSASGAATPVARFGYLFPTAGAGVIQVRLRAGLGDSQQKRAIALIRAAVAMPAFRIAGARYTVAGEPVLLADLGDEIGGQLATLLAVAVGVMALALLAVFRRRLRLLPLAIALAAVAVTFGLTGIAGGRLTLAEVAAFPVLLGLGVDYGVQFRSGTPRGAIAPAALATAAGFLALLVSPVPTVRGFAVLLIVGVCVAFAVAAVALPAGAGPRLATPAHPEPLIASVYGAGEILRGLLPTLIRRPRLVLTLALVLAAAGWALDAHTPVQSDITRLVPADMPALRHLHALERVTGTSGEVDVLVSGRDVTSGGTIAWMRSYERRMNARFGGSAAGRCAQMTLCPALSLPGLLQTAGGSLGGVPAYFQRAVVTPDHRHALLAFGIRLMPLSRQRRVIEQMRAALDAPAGVHAQLAGLPVLAADAEGALASSSARLLMLAVSLILVTLVLIGVLGRRRRVLVPLLPIVLVSGWSALLAYALRIPLNPMSATLGTLVIAITTEFSVLLAEGARRQLRGGTTLVRAFDDTYRTTGVAVLTSALTAIAGFGVLVVSNITMLRDFGLLTLIDLTVSLAGVMLVLPATQALIDPRPGR
jgi:predicted RND superfamily exporter protein